MQPTPDTEFVNINYKAPRMPVLLPFFYLDAGLTFRDCHMILIAIARPSLEVEAQEIIDRHDAEITASLERITAEIRCKAHVMTPADLAQTGQEQPDPTKSPCEFGSAAWFAGIDPIPFEGKE